jgi:6-phosphogluconolactonase
MLKKAASLLLVCASVGAWVGCSTTSNRYLYAAVPASSEIIAFREDPNSGALVELAGSPITAGPEVQSLAMHPSGKYLYAANAGQNNVSLFTISGGSLTEVTPRTNAGTVPTLAVMDPSGNFLYVGNSGTQDISVYSISASNGMLTPVAQTSGATTPIGVSPLNMAVSPSGDYLFVTGQGAQGYVEAFPLSQGVLGTPVTGSPFLTGNNPYGLAVAPSGSYLYTANKLDNSISEFTITSGVLAPLPNSPIGEAYSAPVSVWIDPTSTYLYAANQGSPPNLIGYTVGSDGGLTELSTSPFTTATGPSFIAGDPSGKYLFVGNQSTSSSVESFSIDAGTLTLVGTYSVPGTATSIVLTP